MERSTALAHRSGRLVALAVAVAVSLVTSSVVAQDTEAGIERFNRVSDLLELLGASPGAVVADVGAGDGFYTVRIARAVAPAGRATAVDIDDAALDKLRERAAGERVTNVDVIRGAPDDPHLQPAHFDAVLIHNAYHEMHEHEAMLRHIREALKPGGRLVVVEPMHDSSRGMTREQQIAHHDLDIDLAQPELEAAGFEVLQRDAAFVTFTPVAPGHFWVIVARRPMDLRDRR